MAIVPRNIDAVIKDSFGNVQAAATVEFKPLRVFGDGGILIPRNKVYGLTNGSGALKAADGSSQLTLLTNDDPGAFVRYQVKLPERSVKNFDLVAGSPTTLDELIALYDGSEIASDAALMAQIDARLDTLEAGGGASSGLLGAIYFNYGDATPAILYTPLANIIITSLALTVVTAFNGVGAKVSIGIDASPELLMAEAESDLSVLSSYEFDPEQAIASGSAIKAFITPGSGASQGRCMILIEYASA